MIDEDWRGFASAYTQAVRPDDTAGRTGKRMLAIGFALVVGTAVAALAFGALGAGTAVAKPSEVKPIAPAPAAAGSGAQAPGWSSSATGGYSCGSCTGGCLSLPVSGQRKSYDGDRFALWRFAFGATLTNASCRLSTYVPDSRRRELVGGNPAYSYYQTDYAPGSTEAPLGGYLVSQVTEHGHWVMSKPFKVRTGEVTVKLVDAGSRDGAAAKDAHVAAAQVRITCQGV